MGGGEFALFPIAFTISFCVALYKTLKRQRTEYVVA